MDFKVGQKTNSYKKWFFRDSSRIVGEPAGTRTQDHSIKSRMLYQLSYRFIRTLATLQRT